MSQDTTTMPDWVLIEAAKRGQWAFRGPVLREDYQNSPIFRALCDLILKHEQPPVDRKLLCAREAAAELMDDDGCHSIAREIRSGDGCRDKGGYVRLAILAIELWESGHGK